MQFLYAFFCVIKAIIFRTLHEEIVIEQVELTIEELIKAVPG